MSSHETTSRRRLHRSPIDMLNAEILARALAYLSWKDALTSRASCVKLEAAARAAFACGDVTVDVRDDRSYQLLERLALSGSVVLRFVLLSNESGESDKIYIEDGEDAEEVVHHHNSPRRRLDALANLPLETLYMFRVKLNGRYDFMFGAFPNLRKIKLYRLGKFKWRLEDLQSCPLLEVVVIWGSQFLAGDIASLSGLKHLENVMLDGCPGVIGNMLQLSPLSKLKDLNLRGTSTGGSIEAMADIEDGQFPALERLTLSDKSQEVDSIADASRAMNLAYRLRKTRGIAFDGLFSLSNHSPEYYPIHWSTMHARPILSPTRFLLVEAGCRLGWRWHSSSSRGACEINWFDPEPTPTDEGYQEYLRAVNLLQNEVGIFRGIASPPTREEFVRLAEDYNHVEELVM